MKFQFAETCLPETSQRKPFHILSLADLYQVQSSFLYQNEVDTFLPQLSDFGSFLPNQTHFQSMKSKGLCGNYFPLLFLVSGCEFYNEV